MRLKKYSFNIRQEKYIYKILFELFGSQILDEQNDRQIRKLGYLQSAL